MFYFSCALRCLKVCVCVCVCVCVHSIISDPLKSLGLPGSSVLGTFQARIQEWVAISCSSISSRPRVQTCVFLSFLHCQAGSLPLHHLERSVVILQIIKLEFSNENSSHFKNCCFYRFSKVNCMELFLRSISGASCS